MTAWPENDVWYDRRGARLFPAKLSGESIMVRRLLFVLLLSPAPGFYFQEKGVLFDAGPPRRNGQRVLVRAAVFC